MTADITIGATSPITGRATTPKGLASAQPAIEIGIPIRNPSRNDRVAISFRIRGILPPAANPVE